MVRRRSLRERRLPARLADENVIVESPTVHENSSASNVSQMTPARTASIRQSHLPSQEPRAGSGFFRRSQHQEPPASGPINAPAIETNAADPEPLADKPESVADQPEPVAAQRESIIDTFGLDHTPAYDGDGLDFSDSDTENPKPRWIPSALQSPPGYDDLSDCAKMMILQEMTKLMTFETAVFYLMLTDKQLIDFVEIHDREYSRNGTEDELLEIAVDRIMKVRMERGITDEERQAIIDEEVVAKMPTASALTSIQKAEIDKAIAFLRTFRIQEELTAIEIQTPDGPKIVAPEDIPPFLAIEEIVKQLQTYEGLGTVFEWQYDHDMGVEDYIAAEIELVGSVEDVVLSDEEIEVEQPVPKRVAKPAGPKFGGRRVAKKNKCRG